MSIDFAAAFYNVIENAESLAIPQFEKAMLVITPELVSVISCFFQMLNIGIGQHHFCFFTAYSAMRTTHEQISLQVSFSSFVNCR